MERSTKATRNRVRRDIRKTLLAMPKKPAKTVKKYVKRTIDRNKELKEFEVSGTLATSGVLTQGTWIADPFTSVPQGTTASTDAVRIGDKIELASAYVATNVVFDNVNDVDIADINAHPSMTCRILVIQLKRGFTSADVLAELPTGSPVSSVNTFEISRRCHILKDKLVTSSPDRYMICGQGTTATSVILATAQSVPVRFFIKPKIKNLIWDPDTATGPPDIVGGMFICYTYFAEAAVANVCSIQDTADSRITFRDA